MRPFSVLEIVREYAPGLRQRSPGDWWARCPLPSHYDKGPSFHVNEQSGKWYCFGCAEGGLLWDLVARVEKVSLQEAWMYCRGMGYDPESTEPREYSADDMLVHGIDREIKFWHERMVDASRSLRAVEAKKRKFSWAARARYYKESVVAEYMLEELESERQQVRWRIRQGLTQ